MHSNINLNTNLKGSPLYPGAPSYTSAADVRADLDVLTEEDAEAIFAAVSGARTADRLPKFNADGELVTSAILDSSIANIVGIAGRNSINFSVNSGLYFSMTTDMQFFRSNLVQSWLTSAGHILRGSTCISMAGTASTVPARRLEVVDSANPQLRLTHTSGTHWVDLQALSGGSLVLSNSAGSSTLTFTPGSTISGSPNLYLSCFHGYTIALSHGSLRVFEVAGPNAVVNVGASSRNLALQGQAISLFGVPPVAQCAHIPNAADEADAVTKLNTLLAYLRTRGDVAAS